MKKPPDTPEMARFNDALRQIMTVTQPRGMALLHESVRLWESEGLTSSLPTMQDRRMNTGAFQRTNPRRTPSADSG